LDPTTLPVCPATPGTSWGYVASVDNAGNRTFTQYDQSNVAASLFAGLTNVINPVAPGELVSLLGYQMWTNSSANGTVVTQTSVWPTMLDQFEVSVLVKTDTGWATAPMYSAGIRKDYPMSIEKYELVFQVPFGLKLGATQFVLVANAYPNIAACRGQNSPFMIQIVPAVPAVYRNLVSGQPLVQDAVDGHIVTSEQPLVSGYATVYGFGLGELATSVLAGVPIQISAVASSVTATVNVGGNAADILYVGNTPGQVGLYQVTFKVPDFISLAPDGSNLSLSITAKPVAETVSR
jgi:uncharacterized protein (TIGR03437 family)